MILRRQGDTFTYELDDTDRVALCRNLFDHRLRTAIHLKSSRKVIGSLEFSTMQFKLFDRAKAGVDPIELADEEQVFMEYN